MTLENGRNNDPPASISVLIIDDHTMFTDSLARLLDDEDDIEVRGTAGNAAKGLAMVLKLQPDIVLIDERLPDRSGVSLVAEIKALDPGVYVVMLTGDASDSLLLAAIEAGCAGFITKDRAASDVVDAVRVSATGDAVISPRALTRLLPMVSRIGFNIGDDLTIREREILRLMATGMATGAIATSVVLSVNTIRNYVQSILTKLNAHSRLEAVVIGVREGLVTWDP